LTSVNALPIFDAGTFFLLLKQKARRARDDAELAVIYTTNRIVIPHQPFPFIP
jgi:hypothetical protein